MDIVQETIQGYTGEGLNGYAYLTSDEARTLFTVVVVAQVGGERIVETSLIVRLAEDKVVIEYDDNNKPLIEALVQAGVQRDQIILACLGEPIPQPA
jgi:hypothetical protein